MPISDLQSSLFTKDRQTPDEKAAVIALIGSESPEALDLAEIRAVCTYLRDQLQDIAQSVKTKS